MNAILIEANLEKIEGLRKAANMASGVHKVVRELINPGVSTSLLDRIAEEYILDNGGIPACKGYKMGGIGIPYPATLCVALNDVAVHGIPNDDSLNEGDILALDIGIKLGEYYGDCAATYGVGEISEENKRLLQVTRDALYAGIAEAIEGKWTYDIGKAIQQHIENNGLYVVRAFGGHGIGTRLHEDPFVPNFYPNALKNEFCSRNVQLNAGMVICIEPMVNAGTSKLKKGDDGWTMRTLDGKMSAHFEHMVLVGADKAEILTTHV